MENENESTHLIPLISDYGFKVSFATDGIFARKAIQTLIESKLPIEHLEMLRNEFEKITVDSRSGLYDVVCKDEHSRVFIIEMQVDNYSHFIERLLFYVFHMYCSQIQKGKTGFKNLPTLYCVCIIESQITDFEGYYNKVTFQNQSGALFTDNIEFHLVELGKFPILREEFDKIKTDMEKLAYTLKYAHQFDTKEESSKPPFWKEEWLDDIIQKVDVTRLSPEQRVFFEMSKVKIDMYHEKLEEVASEAKEEVIKEIIIESFKEGLSPTQISKITKIPIEKVLEVIEEFSQK